jgi:hypothetical protein
MAKLVLRKPFSLINSEFNDFLFAPIGDEGNGMTLSVISALTRLDIDPWREAARLADLSKEKAAQAVVAIISRFPGGRWAPADMRDIAARLVAFLPQRAVIAAPRPTAAGAGKANARAIVLVISLALSAAAFLALGMQHQPPLNHDKPPTENTSPS